MNDSVAATADPASRTWRAGDSPARSDLHDRLRAAPSGADDRGAAAGGLGDRASQAHGPDPGGRLRPGVAAAVPPRGGADQGGAGGAGGARLRGRAGLPPGPGGGRVRAGHPGARVVPAPLLQGAGHRRQPARVLARLPGDRALPAVPGAPAWPSEERARYQRVKRELAERDWTYVQEYADAKTEVVEGIIARARGGPGAGAGTQDPGRGFHRPPWGVHNSFTTGRQHREQPKATPSTRRNNATDDGGRGGDSGRPGRDRDRGRGLQRRDRRGSLPAAGHKRRHRPGGQGRRARLGLRPQVRLPVRADPVPAVRDRDCAAGPGCLLARALGRSPVGRPWWLGPWRSGRLRPSGALGRPGGVRRVPPPPARAARGAGRSG